MGRGAVEELPAYDVGDLIPNNGTEDEADGPDETSHHHSPVSQDVKQRKRCQMAPMLCGDHVDGSLLTHYTMEIALTPAQLRLYNGAGSTTDHATDPRNRIRAREVAVA